jgi:hypothetical protein
LCITVRWMALAAIKQRCIRVRVKPMRCALRSAVTRAHQVRTRAKAIKEVKESPL